MMVIPNTYQTLAETLIRFTLPHRRRRFHRDESAASTFEYAVMVSMVASVLYLAVGSMTSSANESLNATANQLEEAFNGKNKVHLKSKLKTKGR